MINECFQFWKDFLSQLCSLRIKNHQKNIHFITKKKSINLIYCNSHSFFLRITKSSGRNKRKRNRLNTILFCNPQTLSVAGAKLLFLSFVSTHIKRTYRMNNILCLQIKARSNESSTFRNKSYIFFSILQKFIIACCLVYSAITARAN